MRIAHIESSMHWGGQELRVIEQTEWLNAHGHQAWLIARPGSAILEEGQRRGLPCLPLEIRGSINPVTIGRLIRFIRVNHIDILDAHSSRDAACASFVKWLTRTKVVRSRHVTTTIRDDFLHRLFWKFGNDGIITTAAIINTQLATKGLASPERIYAATAGVDAQRYRPGLDGSALKQALGIPAHHRVVANIGMIRPDKGQLFFLQAAQIVASQLDDVSFVQIGEATPDMGAYEEQVRALHATLDHRDRIHFLGYHDDIENYQAFCNIVLVCSINAEAQTRLVAQAFLMENNIVATTVGGLPEMIRDGETGLLCPPRDPQALAHATLRLLRNPDFARQIAARAREHALKTMTFEAMMEGMLLTYGKILRGDYPLALPDKPALATRH